MMAGETAAQRAAQREAQKAADRASSRQAASAAKATAEANKAKDTEKVTGAGGSVLSKVTQKAEGEGKPLQKSGESLTAYMARLREWRKNNERREAIAASPTPTPAKEEPKS